MSVLLIKSDRVIYLWIGRRAGTYRSLWNSKQAGNFKCIKIMFMPGAAYALIERLSLCTSNKSDQRIDDSIHMRNLMNLQGRQAGWGFVVFSLATDALHFRDQLRDFLACHAGGQFGDIIKLLH